MPRLRFGAFLAPHHPIGEHPMLQFRRDLDLVEQLDRLGYDEFWCGEHHSSGWEMIASPEMFLAAAGERTKRIKLATGVVSLPYHHPYNVAQRMVQLDHMTGGRAIFGSGPGALASDAHTLGIDPMMQRDRQDEAIGVIRRLMRGERVSHESDWFMLRDAALQLLPLQDEMPFAVASQISPSGMTLAGKHGIGVISIGSLSRRGSTHCRRNGASPNRRRRNTARSRSQGLARAAVLAHRRDAGEGNRRGARGAAAPSQRVHRRHIAAARREAVQDTDEAIEKTAFSQAAAATIGTPDDLVARIKSVLEISGGFGTVVGFVHDWANPENTARSWDMVARYVVPEINGYLAGLRASQQFVATKRAVFDRAKEAIMAKVYENEAAVAALAVTRGSRLGDVASASNAPDLDKARLLPGRRAGSRGVIPAAKPFPKEAERGRGRASSSSRAAVVPGQQQRRAHIQAQKRLTGHLIVAERQQMVLSGRMDVADAAFETAARVGRGRAAGAEHSSVVSLAVFAACVDASHSVARWAGLSVSPALTMFQASSSAS